MIFNQVGWARADCNPGVMIGADDSTWAFDGYNVSYIAFHINRDKRISFTDINGKRCSGYVSQLAPLGSAAFV